MSNIGDFLCVDNPNVSGNSSGICFFNQFYLLTAFVVLLLILTSPKCYLSDRYQYVKKNESFQLLSMSVPTYRASLVDIFFNVALTLLIRLMI